jgi:hypothetical protein
LFITGFGPRLGRTIEPGLPTTMLIETVRDGLQPRWRVTEVAWRSKSDLKGPVGSRRPDGTIILMQRPAEARRTSAAGHRILLTHYAPRPKMDRHVGHCLISLVAGLPGGLAAVGLGALRAGGAR